MKVLILDVSIYIPERLISLISEALEGVTFFRAGTYKEAIARLEEFKPQAVLLDLNFCGKNAITLLNRIKQADRQVVVIILFSIAEDKELRKCKEHGADFLFDKYLDFEKIPEVIRAIAVNDNNDNSQSY